MSTHSARCALVFVAAAYASVLAQQPRDNRPPVSEGTAVLAGRVLTRDADNRPLRKTIVTLRSDDGRIHRTAITDEGGVFLFGGLPGGRYGLDASRRGWPAIAYGAARPHQRGTRIEVADGERADGLTIRMPRGAVLTGSVVDHTGRPMAHTSIVALRFTYLAGRRLLTRYREDYTDERGIFRFYGLAAGEYLVASAGLPSTFDNVGTIHATGEADVRRILDAQGLRGYARPRQDIFVPPAAIGYAPVYYPGTPFRAQAMTIVLEAGEERSALDFEVAPSQTLTVQGLVGRPRDLPPAVSVRVTLRTAGDELASGYVGDDRRTTAAANGFFAIASVPPGTYEVIATAEQDATIVLVASSSVTVMGDHAPRVSLSLGASLTLAGRVAFEGETPPDPSSIRIALQRLPAGEHHVASVDASGAFVVGGLVPGRYHLAASARAPRGESRAWSVRSFVVNRAEMLEAPLDLRSSLAGAVVTFTDRYARLSGIVQDSSGRGAPEFFVVVFPADARLWTPLSHRIHAVRPFSDGRYAVEHLPPGAYFVAVAADLEEGEWFDRAQLSRLAQSSLKIEIAEGQPVVQDLRVH